MNGLVPDGLVRETIRPLPGGNLFEAVNQRGETYYFIGFNVILNEEDYGRIKHGLLGSEITKEESQLIAKHIGRYKKIFQSENVVILPQWTYHLDLQMAYVGQSTFLVHSFDETETFLRDTGEFGRYQEILERAKPREAVVNKLVRKLRYCGFKVIKCCGMILENPIRWDPDRQKHRKALVDFCYCNLASSFFMNGINIYSQHHNKHYFLTLDSENIKHKEYFVRLLKSIGIEAVFLKMNRYSPSETLQGVSHLSGALRCQTNFLPLNGVISEDKVTASSGYPCHIPSHQSSSIYERKLVFSKNSHFAQILEQTCRDLEIKCSITAVCRDMWIRDVFFVAKNNVYVMSKKNFRKKIKPIPKSKSSSGARQCFTDDDKRRYYQDPLSYIAAYQTIDNYFYNHPEIYYTNKACYAAKTDSSDLSDIIDPQKVRETIRPLGGGNLFEAVTPRGETYYFIGFHVMLNEEDYRRMKNGRLGTETIENEWRLISRNRGRYEEILGKNVVILPQWARYLENQMAYVGQSTFLVHSFEETETFLRDTGEFGRYQEILERAKPREVIVNQLVKRLEDYGFKVIKCCGMILEKPVKWDPDRQEYYKAPVNFINCYPVSSLFMNGIDVYSNKTKQHYFLTVDSKNVEHRNYFIRLLKSIGIEVIFLKMDGCDIPTTIKKINDLKGGLRAQTNFLPYQYGPAER